MEWRYLVEVVAVLIMAGGVGAIIYLVFKGTLGLSFRTVQFLAIAFVGPAVVILSMERSIGSEATAAIIGTIVGYALSGSGGHD